MNARADFLPGSHQYLLTAANAFWGVGLLLSNGVRVVTYPPTHCLWYPRPSATCQFAFRLSSLFDFFAPFQQAEKLIYVLVHNNGTYDQHTLVGELSEKWSRLYK